MKTRLVGGLLSVSVLVFGCAGDAAAPPTAPLIPTPGFTEPAPTETGSALASAVRPLPIKLAKLTRSVRRGALARVTVITARGARCEIVVTYDGVTAKAKGLSARRATKGAATWRWRVTKKVAAGRWPIDVTCRKGDQVGSLTTLFTVK